MFDPYAHRCRAPLCSFKISARHYIDSLALASLAGISPCMLLASILARRCQLMPRARFASVASLPYPSEKPQARRAYAPNWLIGSPGTVLPNGPYTARLTGRPDRIMRVYPLHYECMRASANATLLMIVHTAFPFYRPAGIQLLTRVICQPPRYVGPDGRLLCVCFFSGEPAPTDTKLVLTKWRRRQVRCEPQTCSASSQRLLWVVFWFGLA